MHQPFQLGGPGDPFTVVVYEEGLDPHSIAPEQKAALLIVPDGKGELTAKVLHEIQAPLLVGVNDDLAISGRSEHVAAILQPAPERLVVVDHPVHDGRDGARFVQYGLPARLEVDDGESSVTEDATTGGGDPEASGVRTATAHPTNHALNVGSSVLVQSGRAPSDDSRDSAHASMCSTPAGTQPVKLPQGPRWNAVSPASLRSGLEKRFAGLERLYERR